MKKIVAALMTGIILSSVAVSTASAQVHEVEPGENLWDIANDYSTTVDELVQINDLKNTVIQPKQILYINNTYIVQRGDTLLSIGKEYDVSVDELMEMNDLQTSLIVIGQELQIQGVNVDKEDSKLPQPAEVDLTETPKQAPAKQQTKAATNKPAEQKSQGKTLSVTATAYTAECDGCSGITKTGIDLNKNRHAKVIAVDPTVIPLGSEVYVEGYGYAIAADIGSAIKGNKIDLHVPTTDEAFAWGVRTVDVTIVE